MKLFKADEQTLDHNKQGECLKIRKENRFLNPDLRNAERQSKYRKQTVGEVGVCVEEGRMEERSSTYRVAPRRVQPARVCAQSSMRTESGPSARSGPLCTPLRSTGTAAHSDSTCKQTTTSWTL